MSKLGPDLPRPKMPTLKKGKIDLTQAPPSPGEIHDPYGVLAKFMADKAKAKKEAAQRAADKLAKKREHYRETGTLLEEEKPEPPKKGGRGRKSTPATMWLCMADGQIKVEEHEKTGATHDLAKSMQHRSGIRWIRVFNEKGGRIYFGPSWVNSWDVPPGEPMPVNMPNSVWLQLTRFERHQVKEREIPKYVKPGPICEPPRKELPSQKAKTSKKGQTWARMQRAQGLGR